MNCVVCDPIEALLHLGCRRLAVSGLPTIGNLVRRNRSTSSLSSCCFAVHLASHTLPIALRLDKPRVIVVRKREDLGPSTRTRPLAATAPVVSRYPFLCLAMAVRVRDVTRKAALVAERANPVGLSPPQGAPRVVCRHNRSYDPTCVEWPGSRLRTARVPRVACPAVAISEGAQAADVAAGYLSWLWVVHVGVEVVPDVVDCAARVGAAIRASRRSRKIWTGDLPDACLDRYTACIEARGLAGGNDQRRCTVCLPPAASRPVRRNGAPRDDGPALVGLASSDCRGVGSGG